MKLSGGSSLRREWRYLLIAVAAGLYLGAIVASCIVGKATGM